MSGLPGIRTPAFGMINHEITMALPDRDQVAPLCVPPSDSDHSGQMVHCDIIARGPRMEGAA